MTDTTDTKPLAAWHDAMPDWAPYTQDKWHAFIATLAGNMPAGTRMEMLRPNTKKFILFEITGPDINDPNDEIIWTFHSQRRHFLKKDVFELSYTQVAYNSRNEGLGHSVFVTGLAAGAALGCKTARFDTMDDGNVAWAPYRADMDWSSEIMPEFKRTMKGQLKAAEARGWIGKTERIFLSRALVHKDAGFMRMLIDNTALQQSRTLDGVTRPACKHLLTNATGWSSIIDLQGAALDNIFAIVEDRQQRGLMPRTVTWRPHQGLQP